MVSDSKEGCSEETVSKPTLEGGFVIIFDSPTKTVAPRALSHTAAATPALLGAESHVSAEPKGRRVRVPFYILNSSLCCVKDSIFSDW